MATSLLNERDLDFMLYELLEAESLTERERFSDHSRETFQAAMDTAKNVAEKYLLPIRQKTDLVKPEYDGNNAHLIPEIKTAMQAVIDAGLASATADFDMGGMQLPSLVSCALNTHLTASGMSTMGYTTLTNANANLIQAHGTDAQIEKWVRPMRAGRFTGTMAMTEPGAGSGLADLITKAVKQEDGSYRITGNKVYISGGDHDLTDNIVHLVLARVQGAPKGIKGISLFIVPKFLVGDDGALGARNDVALAGLFHKMGGHAITSTSLSFGEKDGAVGYLVGEENMGLSYMFHMMNEARLFVGMGATVMALAGYQYSLNYAKERPQGRLLAEKDPHSTPVNIIEHSDVKRMLLAQKAYAEGALALCLYGARLHDDEKTAPDHDSREAAHTLLDFLTPIIKSWPSEYGLKANHYAIQVLGGAGYTNEHPVEMFYRENRLNPIHEGTTGIQSMDLLGRKVPRNNFAGYKACVSAIGKTITEAQTFESLNDYATSLESALKVLDETTQRVLGASQTMNVDAAFSNSVKYLDMFGHIVIAWMWLKQGVIAKQQLNGSLHESDEAFYNGKLQAMRFFFRSELPEIYHWAHLVGSLDTTNFDMKPDWF
ncbi:acyl-CoA dehydrogenase [Salinimonas chungwhensis]|uniref:acyl-CoA dehydrogenase n=1 Tax=Salinimonas chungwhensis TaxID=265425 RepID=UPI00037ECB71|nr:acyl-CoA dehydrogenase [Salinimonas chungwhensis]